jgi:hypothetical protein
MCMIRMLASLLCGVLISQLSAVEGETHPRPPASAAPASDEAKAFTQVDTDGDGALSANDLPKLMDEMMKLKGRQPPAFMKAKIIKRMTDEADVNQDGRYVLSEIEKFVAGLP